ncbi:hypothetical protein BV25DRAFT_1961811 [Artomyces pyxidatus]|uniref:Uncharacterized protein n=1 Tax=Artomyces pyxidatus TaxID=48021 RepID=A0ACB8SSM6_9AGAM|nr:hypothetical protein BV25DRAFT_1961811 [Artomyces pyxidatus]
MSSCAICSGLLKGPTALPCGHTYCHDCMTKAAAHSSTSTPIAECSTCRASFSVVAIEVSPVSQPLRHYFLPPLRRISFDTPAPPPPPPPFPANSSSTSPPPILSPRATLSQANYHTLREHCLSWSQRAEGQAPASLGLSTLALMVKEQERTHRKERDEFLRKCELLLKQFYASHARLSCCAAAPPENMDVVDCSYDEHPDPDEEHMAVSPS